MSSSVESKEAIESKEAKLSIDAVAENPVRIDGPVNELSEKSFWLKTRRWIRSIGAEEFGVERIPEELRTNQNPRDLFTIFFSANCNTATLALGFLAPTLFGLGWWDSFCVIIFFNLLGAVWPALAARFGPKLGLRTMVIPRYCFGWWPAKVLAILNCLNQIGWAMVNCISGASVLYDMSDEKMPLAVCVLLIALLAISIGLFGYKVLHHYERYVWIVMLICFIILAGFGGKHFINLPMGSGSLEAANVLSMATSIIGFQVAWLPVAADYGVYLRETTSGKITFTWMYLGLVLSQIFIELLGAAIGTLAMSSDPVFIDAYGRAGLGGLIGACFEGHGSGAHGFGKFIEAILGFSTVGVIITNVYSLGLGVQMVSTKLLIVPRLVWSLIGGAIFLVCSVAGREHLESVMENFLLVVAYWVVPFSTIILLEHFIWRRNYDYDFTAYLDKNKLPYGIAASTSFIIATVIALLCMSQTWWVGPIAKGVGGSPYGTDISWELSTVIVTILYVPLRYWERKKWGL